MSWWRAALQGIGLGKAAPVTVAPDAPRLIDSGVGMPAAPSFPVVASMATFAEFPWVRAAVDAISADLSGLPLRVVRGDGKDAEVVQVPELTRLLAEPQLGMSRRQWERQLITYLLPTGNAYAIRVGGTPQRPSSLVLLHPESVRIIADGYGYPAAYEVRSFGGGAVVYSAELILHIRLTAWENGPQGLMGEGLIRALKNDLNADRAAARLSASQANQGRPTAVFSPKGEEQPTKEQRQAVADGYAKATAENRPCIVLPVGFDATFPSHSLRDMEFTQQRTLTRETILAAFSVPPVRVGLPQANFATAREQSAIYWQSLIGLSALIDDALTMVARGYGADLSVRHDFSGVEALQQSRDSRLNRVSSWVMLGASAAKAAAYEGFDDAPVGDELPTEEAEQQPEALAVGQSFARWWDESPRLALVPPASPVEPRGTSSGEQAAVDAPDPIAEREAARGALWRGWLSDVQAPAERTLAQRVRVALAQQQRSVLDNLTALWPDLVPEREEVARSLATLPPETVERDLADVLKPLLDKLFPQSTQSLLLLITGDAYRAGIRTAFRRAAQQVGATLSADRVDPVAERLLALMVTRVNTATIDALARIVSTGIQEGLTIAEMQAKMQSAVGFSPMRALRVARTETTRSVNAGSQYAWQAVASDGGLDIQKEWLSARDGEVRDEHRELDGQTVPLGGMFVIQSGEFAGKKASGPGDFDHVALCVNCRCTVLPVVKDE